MAGKPAMRADARTSDWMESRLPSAGAEPGLLILDWFGNCPGEFLYVVLAFSGPGVTKKGGFGFLGVGTLPGLPYCRRGMLTYMA